MSFSVAVRSMKALYNLKILLKNTQNKLIALSSFFKTQQEAVTDTALEDDVRDLKSSSHQEEEQAGVNEENSAAAAHESSAGQDIKESKQTNADQIDINKAEQLKTEEGGGGTGKGRESDGEEGKGMKRKREDELTEEETEQSPDKKKVNKYNC